jgi:C-terminal processing protease CtpA/Prc
MSERFFVIVILGMLAGAVRASAGAPLPDFKEVQQVVREHLAGATDESVNRAAIDGLILALKGRAELVTPASDEATNRPALVARQEVFDDGVGYARVGLVADGLAAAVAKSVSELGASNKLSGLVLDLRFAGGNDYAAAAAVADLFLKSEIPLLNGGKGLVSSSGKTNAIRMPVVALVNSETVEAAEALAAVLRQTGLGLLLGNKTAGRAGVRSDFKLSTGQTLRVVTAPVLLGDAKPVAATGVLPDIEVPVKIEAERAFYADAPATTSKVHVAGATNSVARSAKRVRVTEADLVREKRGDGDFESVTNARVKAEPEVYAIQDPALSRAIDLLKGLAVVRPGGS